MYDKKDFEPKFFTKLLSSAQHIPIHNMQKKF